MEENFEEYMAFFKSQPLKEKQDIIFNQLKMLAGFTNDLCRIIGVPNDMILNKELVDLKKDNYTEDDFAEAMIVLINSIQHSICDYSNGISDTISKLTEGEE